MKEKHVHIPYFTPLKRQIGANMTILIDQAFHVNVIYCNANTDTSVSDTTVSDTKVTDSPETNTTKEQTTGNDSTGTNTTGTDATASPASDNTSTNSSLATETPATTETPSSETPATSDTAMNQSSGTVNYNASMSGGGAVGGDAGTMADGNMMGATVKDPLLSNWVFVIGISVASLAIGAIIGLLLAKKKIKKGIELYED